ncbi:MAG: N-6 DNA methylase [Treponema sp.]|nr:N-6 DNA methylase [Treponema sp.]
MTKKLHLCDELGVSAATVNNWIKTKVIPAPDDRGFYSKSIYDHILDTIKNNRAGEPAMRLSSRANRTLLKKKSLCYLGITNKERKTLLLNLVNVFEKSGLSAEDGVLAVVFSMLRANEMIGANCTAGAWQLNANSKLDMMLSDWIGKTHNPEKMKTLFIDYKIANLNDDILGAFYQSVLNISQKSGFGAYYTPSCLLTDIKIKSDKTILDPCCGSGNILLNILSKEHDPAKIYIRDIDETALKICYINLVLFFNDKNITPNILKQDITSDNTFNRQFDYIVTNPPWGSKYTMHQKEHLVKLYPQLSTPEIFSIALFNARKMLKENGELYFFLPYSFLNVTAHKNIRRCIFNENNKITVKLLGNAFKGVLSESIRLHLKSSSYEKYISIQNKNTDVYQIPLQNITPPDFLVSAVSKTQDTLIMEKMYKTEHTTLKDAVFALGIVTGNNKKHLTKDKTAKAIYRGKDIEKYTLLKPCYYFEFKPDLFQQAAPLEYYQKEKIVYRFISDRLICALDSEGSFLLNSANLFISGNYPMRAIVSFFNSDIYTFILRKKFNSKKVLKSHLQDLPLPVLSDKTHQYISDLYNEAFSEARGQLPGISMFQEKIDRIICEAFGIDENEMNYIKTIS